ncbi:MAG TPA: 2-C-methyl-D-erythritol 2,4-cyclodiphosphate synthase [Bacteroidetes bacterium]|nr:2-C-methyl-D-erythritol 2,4-cyclodiphosphate synthase [Bacteroidota bacterium]
MNIRTGQGIDFHKLVEGRPLWLGGINIPSGKGCQAHSDGDVLIHAICDALLGAAGLRDIGYHFPDTDEKYEGIDSRILLKETIALIAAKGFAIINIDSTICLEEPRLSDYIEKMRDSLAEVCAIEKDLISVKATTTEKMGFTGRGEGIAAIASVLLGKR